jgi:hypothetical protein
MISDEKPSPGIDRQLYPLGSQLDISRSVDVHGDCEAGVVADSLITFSHMLRHVSDARSRLSHTDIGSARLASYIETREEGHLLAAFNMAQSLPVQALSPSSPLASTLEGFLQYMYWALGIYAENNRQTALEYAVAISRLSLVLRHAEDDTRAGFLESRASAFESLFRERERNGCVSLDLLMEAIILRRRLIMLAVSDEKRLKMRAALALLLRIYRERNDENDVAVLNEEIDMRRDILYAHKGHDSEQRVLACDELATSLSTHFDHTGDMVMLNEALGLGREALALRPVGHPKRAESCGNLAISLWTRFNQTGDTSLLDEALGLQREALALQPVGHSQRAEFCGNLATLLCTRFEQTGDTALLDEALELQREALALRPVGHPDRALFCGNLAHSLRTRFRETGEMSMLDEALELQREALTLQPKRHSKRAESCGNLAASLCTRFDQTGDTSLLDEALDLDREALALQSVGHSEHATSCGNLATSLWTRFKQIGDMALLDEALGLQREALTLRPVGHPERARCCRDLANSLWTRFDQTGDTSLLDEAFDLDREALALQSVGHSEHATSCGNLATSLWTRFKQTGDMALLDEALELQREALALRPVGHSERAKCCISLVGSLCTRFNQTSDRTLLDEAHFLCSQVIKERGLSPSEHVALRVQLAHIHALPAYPSYSLSAAAVFLKEATQYRPALIEHFYSMVFALNVYVKTHVANKVNAQLLAVYQALIEVLPEVGSTALDRSSRLHRWRDAANLPQDALLRALQAKKIALGLELLEQGRAVLWSQTLAMQGSQLQGLTEEWRTPLQTLLHSMRSFSDQGHAQLDSTARDQAHASYNRLQQLLKAIRGSPGLERFMRGPSYSDLARLASVHPVVIIVADDKACHALVMSSGCDLATHLVLDKIMATDLEALGHDVRGLDLNVRAMSGITEPMEVRGISVSGRRKCEDSTVRKLHQALARLWVRIVKPILDFLRLKVRRCTSTYA